MRIGIAIDDWKLPVFKKILSREGFEYTEGSGVTGDTVILYIETKDTTKLRAATAEANNTAIRNHDKKFN